MNVAVTGPTGHVGGNLVRALIARGDSVRALVYQDGPALAGLEVEKVQGNVLDPDSLRRAFQDADVVYHLA
ncbi:MAG: NAD(P)H-binding protein, partial [Candidatus Hydrogenedentes bacterium]|nr:NAD(P)H-binding protein [Candidatus Hydrogenedentota bacterium]